MTGPPSKINATRYPQDVGPLNQVLPPQSSLLRSSTEPSVNYLSSLDKSIPTKKKQTSSMQAPRRQGSSDSDDLYYRPSATSTAGMTSLDTTGLDQPDWAELEDQWADFASPMPPRPPARSPLRPPPRRPPSPQHSRSLPLPSGASAAVETGRPRGPFQPATEQNQRVSKDPYKSGVSFVSLLEMYQNQPTSDVPPLPSPTAATFNPEVSYLPTASSSQPWKGRDRSGSGSSVKGLAQRRKKYDQPADRNGPQPTRPIGRERSRSHSDTRGWQDSQQGSIGVAVSVDEDSEATIRHPRRAPSLSMSASSAPRTPIVPKSEPYSGSPLVDVKYARAGTYAPMSVYYLNENSPATTSSVPPLPTSHSESTLFTTSGQPPKKKRQHALSELLETERAYASDLALVKDYHMPLALGQQLEFKGRLISGRYEETSNTTEARISGVSTNTTSSGNSGTGSGSSGPSTAAPPSANMTPAPKTNESKSNFELEDSSLPMSLDDYRVIFSNLDDLAVYADAFADLIEKALGSEVSGGRGEDRIGQLFVESVRIKIFILGHAHANCGT